MNYDVTAKKIHLLGLIGLRALAEYDLAEFTRVTELSKRAISDKILSYMKEVKDPETNAIYNDLHNSIDIAENSNELNFLLKQLHFTCMQRSQYLSLRLQKMSPESLSKNTKNTIIIQEKNYNNPKLSLAEEFTRLSTMLLLKKLPSYDAKFNFKIKNHEVDALLESSDATLPTIIIETKLRYRSNKLKLYLNQIINSLSLFGPNTIWVLILPTTSVPDENLPKNVFVLPYDYNNNVFESDREVDLIKYINETFE